MKAMKKLKQPLCGRLSPLAKGRLIGLSQAGTERGDIAKKVEKKDGSAPALRTVDSVL